jgi:hypothetical protein
MSLYIVTSKEEICCHIGEIIPARNPYDVLELQADCDELIAIRNLFASDRTFTIPMPQCNRVVRWFGDIARTIYANLPNRL